MTGVGRGGPGPRRRRRGGRSRRAGRPHLSIPSVTMALGARLAAGRLGRVRYATGRFAGLKRPRADVGVTHRRHPLFRPLQRTCSVARRRKVSAVQLGLPRSRRSLDDMSVTMVMYDDVPVVVGANYFASPGRQRECVIVGERSRPGRRFRKLPPRPCTSASIASATGVWEAVDEVEELAATGPEPLRLELEALLAAAGGTAPTRSRAQAGVRAPGGRRGRPLAGWSARSRSPSSLAASTGNLGRRRQRFARGAAVKSWHRAEPPQQRRTRSGVAVDVQVSGGPAPHHAGVPAPVGTRPTTRLTLVRSSGTLVKGGGHPCDIRLRPPAPCLDAGAAALVSAAHTGVQSTAGRDACRSPRASRW